MKLINKSLNFFLLLSLLFLVAHTQANPVQNRNITWEANSCWISVGIQALTACAEFVETYKSMTFAPNTPEQHLKDILIEIVDNELVMHNGRLVSKKKLVNVSNFYTSLAQKGVVQHGSGGGLFVPQFLRYLKTYVNPEFAYYYFGTIFLNKKNYIFNEENIQGNTMHADFECNYREPSIFSLGKYCLLSINVEKSSSDYALITAPKNFKNIPAVIQRPLKNIATLSLVAKALDGYSSSSIPRGNHTIAMVQKDESNNIWFLYDDLNKLVKKIEYQTPVEDGGYAATYFQYKNGADIYTTDLVYFKVGSPQPADSSSIFTCIKTNQFDKIDNPEIKATLNTPEATTSFSALHLACIKANREMIKKLVEMGANCNTTTNLGDTPLHFAAMTCSGDTIQYLVTKGADVNAINKIGRTPLYYAISNVNPFAIDSLLGLSAEINFHLKEIKNVESAQPLFNYFLNKISTQNIIALAPIIEKISASKKLTHFDTTKIQSFLNAISNHWNLEASEKIKIALNKILTQPDTEEISKPSKKSKKIAQKLTQLKNGLDQLKTQLTSLRKNLKSLRKKIS